MKQLFFIFFSLSLISFSFAQSYKEQYATKLSSELRFVQAYPVWSELSTKTLKSKVKNWSFLRKTIEAAYNSEQYNDALYWSQKLAANNQMEEKDWITFFSVLQITKNYSRLSQVVDSASLKLPQSNLIQSWKQNVPVIINQLTINSDYSIAKFRETKTGEEFCAVPYQGGYVLVSNRRNTGFVNRNYPWTGQFFSDLIAINGGTDIAKDNLWKEVKRTNPHDGPIAFSSDFKTAVLTVNQNEIDKLGKVKFSRLSLKIYRNKEGKWVEAESFPFNNKSYSVGHGVFDLDGNLVFASDKPGGFGGVDIYKSEFKEGAWSAPVNLGEKVNTIGDEMFPFVSNNGTFYFSSNGLPGNGGLDVFYQETVNSNVVHVGNPINTNADDFGIYIDENTGKGLLSSNRNNFKDEVYTISKPVYKIEAEITLTTCDQKPLKSKEITIMNNKTQSEEKLMTDENGKISIKPSMNTNYDFIFLGNENNLACSVNKTFDQEGQISIPLVSTYKDQIVNLLVLDENGKNLVGAQLTFYSNGTATKRQITDAQKITFTYQEFSEIDSIIGNLINYSDGLVLISKKDECFDFKNVTILMNKKTGSDFINLGMIYYDFDLWNLRPESKVELDKLVKYMKEHPDLIVELGSHTDSWGSDSYNEKLAERRSQSCVNYIKTQGIPKDKIIAKGYGEKQLVNNCSNGVKCSKAEHQMNRRTELKIKLD